MVNPPLELANIPFKSPVIPLFFSPRYAPLKRICPKLVIGTLAPASLKPINLSYTLS